MKKSYAVVTLIVLSLFNLSMSSDKIYGILTHEDYRTLEESRKSGPALSSVPGTSPYWESYNEWLCFSADNAGLRLSEHELERPTFVPTLSIWLEDHLYEFEVSSSLIDENGASILQQWHTLLEDEPVFCILAAFLQPLGSDSSLWILHTLKTQNGYWRESELE